MKIRLLEFIACPSCHSGFELRIDKEEKIEYEKAAVEKMQAYLSLRGEAFPLDSQIESFTRNVLSGELSCTKCLQTFKIIDGIPRLGDDQEYGKATPQEEHYELQSANQSHYSFEWQVFSHEYEEWARLYRENYVSESAEFFEGKIGLDAGCGMARYSIPPVHNGAEVIGVDLSEAIQVAYKKSLREPTFHALQGDIFKLPFKDDTFDFAQSLGVLHHTPDPMRAFQSIKRVVLSERKIFLYLYQSYRDHNLLKHYLLMPVNLIRSVSSKLASPLLYVLLYPVICFVILFCYFPTWLMYHIPAFRKYADILPYSYIQYRSRKIRDIHMNLFDRLGNPEEKRYTAEEIEKWMDSAGLSSYSYRDGYGWLVTAVK